MKKEYDFSKSKKNPYAKSLKRQITMLVDKETIEYFKGLALETGIAYQLLINLYLKECAEAHKKPSLKWQKQA